MDDLLLIAGTTNPALAEHATFASGRGQQVVLVASPRVQQRVKGSVELCDSSTFTAKSFLAGRTCPAASTLVVYLEAGNERLWQQLTELAGELRPRCFILVSHFSVHLGNESARVLEERAVKLFQRPGTRLAIFRPGHLLSPQSAIRRCPFLFALLPGRLQSVCVEPRELFAAIEQESKRSDVRRQRVYTLLGPNKPWHEHAGLPSTIARTLAHGLRLLGQLFLLGPILAWLLNLLGKNSLNFDTLRPASLKELLALYNPYNCRYVKVVGYNNGVIHFGHRFLGRTVVSTVRCNKLARVRGELGQFDGGVTIRQAMTVLAAADKELHVVPNYSYVTLGTAFFVPIHGSASQFCTVGETINKAWLYEPASDRVIATACGQPDFGRFLYNLSADVLVWRVQVQVKERSRYTVQQESMDSPPAEAVWACFQDATASNVEIRKAGSAARDIRVYRYYPETTAGDGTLDVPRDRLGSLWDRLEENALTSYLFHTLTRLLAHHVELFLARAEFDAFWATHTSVPIAKIQLRYIKRDGFANSPFRDQDCVSADLFMLKRHKRACEDWLARTLPNVKMNPGKHSR